MYILTLKFAKDGMFGPYILKVCKYVVFQSAFHKNDNIIQMKQIIQRKSENIIAYNKFKGAVATEDKTVGGEKLLF